MKECGACTLCCKVLDIPELSKPAGRWCVHITKGRGCGIYENRPHPCRIFTCGWLATPEMGEEWKPNVAKFLVRDERAEGHLCIDVDPGHPHAWKAQPYYGQIKSWSRMVHEQTGCVLVYSGPRTIVVFPEEDIDIGDFSTGQRLIVGYRKVAGQSRPMVRLMDGDSVAREWMGQQTRA